MTHSNYPPPQYNAEHQPVRPRIEFIDTAKGICILLVVMFHTGIISEHTPILGMLRMPFYFTLSGIFFKDYGGFMPTLTKKINKLFIPFIFFFTISYAIFVGIRLFIGGEIDIPYYCFVTSKTMVNIALWFLLALFCANILFFAIVRICNNNLFLIGIMCVASSIFALNILSDNVFLPLYMDSAFGAVPFLFFGYFLRKVEILVKSDKDKYYYLSIPILLAITYLAYIIGHEPHIGFGSLSCKGNSICFYIGACSIVLATLLICKKIGNIPGIKYIGRYSIIILGMHLTISSIAFTIYHKFSVSTDYFTFNVPLFLVTLCCSILCIPILTKYAPKLTAQKDLIPDIRSFKKTLPFTSHN